MTGFPGAELSGAAPAAESGRGMEGASGIATVAIGSKSDGVKRGCEQQIDGDQGNDGEHNRPRRGHADALSAARYAEAQIARQRADERAEHAGLYQAGREIADLDGVERVTQVL